MNPFYCQRLRCSGVSPLTCAKRQAAKDLGPGSGGHLNPEARYPECKDCPQGKAVLAQYLGLLEEAKRRKLTPGVMQGMPPLPREPYPTYYRKEPDDGALVRAAKRKGNGRRRKLGQGLSQAQREEISGNNESPLDGDIEKPGGDEMAKFICEICGAKFEKPQGLGRHRTSQHGEAAKKRVASKRPRRPRGRPEGTKPEKKKLNISSPAEILYEDRATILKESGINNLDNVILISFNEHPQIREKLEEKARAEFRTSDGQILAILHDYFELGRKIEEEIFPKIL